MRFLQVFGALPKGPAGRGLRYATDGAAALQGLLDDSGGKGGAAEGESRSRVTVGEVDKHVRSLQRRSRKTFGEIDSEGHHDGKFLLRWKEAEGHKVAYRFKLQPPRMAPKKPQPGKDGKDAAPPKPVPKPYTDYTGLRFPTLESAENYDYHQDKGLYKLVERAFPIKVPGHRRLDPYLREYIHFLHNLDPARFTIERIGERYRLRKHIVQKVVQEFGVNRYLTRSGLTRLAEKQSTRDAMILKKKEEAYARWVGYDQMGDEDDAETDDESLGDYRGWRSTNDWVRRQSVEVEMMSAFPMTEKRDSMPKRVDVDMVVEQTQRYKVINWIDPNDKVVF